MRIFHVDIPIFNRSVVVCVDCEYAEAREHIYDYKGFRTEIPEISSGRGACVLTGGDAFMWVKESDDASTVFHELVHVAWGICELCGIRTDEELLAYLMGWLKQNVADAIFFPPKKVKRKK